MRYLKDPEVLDSLRTLAVMMAGASVFGRRWPWLAAITTTAGAALVVANVVRARQRLDAEAN